MKGFFVLLVFFISLFLYSQEEPRLIGEWTVETVEALQIIQVYTDGFDHFSNAYLLRPEYLEDPLTYISFDFIDEDLLYVTRADGSRLRGFYQIRENSGINREDFPVYIYMEDKYSGKYAFPLKDMGENRYMINYTLELGLRDQLVQIKCIAYLYREKL